jgi:TRAP transporter 4TM/12TM fusion protein
LLGAVGTALLASMPVCAIVFVLEWYRVVLETLWQQQFVAAFLGIMLAAAFIYAPATSAAHDRVPWYDLVLAAVALAVCGYLAVTYPDLILDAHSPLKAGLGMVIVAIVFEATRRLVGWTIVITCALFILYAHYAYLLPGALRGSGASWTHLFSFLFVDAQAMLGTPLVIATSVVIAFVIFGELLHRGGGADFINRFALAATGRLTGGPAKVAVVSSAMMGTISGSGVSNVMLTGVVTIPMMKKVGYRPEFAAGVEAVASTGGAIMPPIMGAAAFIMADYLGVPYTEIIVAALIPALLYYCGVFFQVDLEARKYGLRALDRGDDTVPLRDALIRESWTFVLPVAALLYALFGLNLRAESAGLWGAGCAAAIFIVRRLPGPLVIVDVLRRVGLTMLGLGVLCAIAGILLGAIVVSGLGLRLSSILVAVGGDNIVWLCLLVAGICIIIGMGLPATAIYILLATLIAPAMVQLGVSAMAAHLFVFYFGHMSLITPPVALAAFAAAALAEANPTRAGLEAVRLGIVAYLVPFAFLFSPTLLMSGALAQIAIDFGSAVFGIFLLSVAVTGYLSGLIPWPWRVYAFLAGVLLFTPSSNEVWLFHWFATAAGFIMAAPFLIWRARCTVTTRSE